jgi:aerotaxis receptor
MRKTDIVPQNRESEFKLNELFFSTTDRKGIITSGNSVFVRVSGYSLEELLGQPHNIIRHPDIPRCVFKLLWDYILAGKPIAAYVKNMAKDGSYYWVLTYVTPIGSDFLSIRVKPSTAVRDSVAAVYEEMRAIELKYGDDGEAGEKGMAEAAAYLGQVLNKLGFADYDAFMRTILREELKNRDRLLAKDNVSMIPKLPQLNADYINPLCRQASTTYYDSQRAYLQINALFADLDEYARLSENLTKKSAFVLEITKYFRFIALNTSIKSARLGDKGSSLGVIAQHMGEASGAISRTVAELSSLIQSASSKLGSVIFSLASARLELETIMVFCHEIVALASGAQVAGEQALRHRRMIEDLQMAFKDTMTRAMTALLSLRTELEGLSGQSDALRKTTFALQFAQLGGLVEASRLDQGSTFGAIFDEVRKQLEKTKQELVELSAVIRDLGTLVEHAPKTTEEISKTVSSTQAPQAVPA